MGRAATPKTNCALLRAFATCTHPRPLANRPIDESYWKDAVITVPSVRLQGQTAIDSPFSWVVSWDGDAHEHAHTQGIRETKSGRAGMDFQLRTRQRCR